MSKVLSLLTGTMIERSRRPQTTPHPDQLRRLREAVASAQQSQSESMAAILKYVDEQSQAVASVGSENARLRQENESVRQQLSARPPATTPNPEHVVDALDRAGGKLNFRVVRDLNNRIARLDGGAVVFDVHRDPMGRMIGVRLEKRS